MATGPGNHRIYEQLPGIAGGGDTLIYSAYHAPRGRLRLYALASKLAERYLYPTDLLIGVIGAEGAGKSILIRGLFSGLELTNDDRSINQRPARLYEFDPNDCFSGHTFHVDIRHELAFRQPYEIAEAIHRAVSHGRRVVVEHFDLIYEALGCNAQMIFGIGEEVIVARPTVFGPFPAAVRKVVYHTIKYRLMAHTAEDLTGSVLERDYHYRKRLLHSDVTHGFVINFPEHEKPAFDVVELEAKVNELIRRDLAVEPAGDDVIRIGDALIYCTGTRTHVKSTGQIEQFRLVRELRYNPISHEYLLIGVVGRREPAGFEELMESAV
jgi:GTPase SAR1 family protein